jgi:hypothetical protein
VWLLQLQFITFTHILMHMYVQDAGEHLKSAKASVDASVANMSLDTAAPPPTLWAIVDLDRPVFCPANSICVASKLEVSPSLNMSLAARVHSLFFSGRARSRLSNCISRAHQSSDPRSEPAHAAENPQEEAEAGRCKARD